MDYLDDVIKAIKPILKDYGFKKKDLNWFAEDENIIKIFNIQKSQYSKKVYLNIGILLKKIEEKSGYSIVDCHIRFGLDHLINRDFLDFEIDINSILRLEEFKNLISGNPYKFFTLTGTTDEIMEFIRESKTLVITKLAKEYLELS
jgi:hypothetical protein